MSELTAFSLGPIPTDRGSDTLYMGILDGRLLPTSPARNADGALATFRKQVPPGTRLCCLPELEAASKKNGFEVVQPTIQILAIRALVAVILAHPGRSLPVGGEMYPLLHAAAAFWEERPWERLPAAPPIAVEITGSFAMKFEAAVMGAGGQEFGLALYSKAGSIAKLAKVIDRGRPDLAMNMDTIGITFDPDPAFVIGPIREFCGLSMVPNLVALRRGRERPVDGTDVLCLAAAIRALLGMKGDPGETGSFRFSAPGLELLTTVRLPGGGLPAPRPRARRAPRKGTV